jgi:hypothetical protein
MVVVLAGPALTETLADVCLLEHGGEPLVRARVLDGLPQHAGWIATGELGGDEAALLELLRRAGRDAGGGPVRADVAATLAAQGVAWAFALPAAAALLLRRRVPGLDPARSALRLGEGSVPAEVGVGAGVHTLPGDALADAPDAHVLRGEAALLDALWEGLEVLLAPLLAALRAATGRPERALWRVAHDALANALVAVGEVADARDEAWALWAAASPRAPARLRGRARPVALTLPSGARAPLLLRAGCCLVWRADGQRTCAGCPLTPDEERPALVAAEAG